MPESGRYFITFEIRPKGFSFTCSGGASITVDLKREQERKTQSKISVENSMLVPYV